MGRRLDVRSGKQESFRPPPGVEPCADLNRLLVANAATSSLYFPMVCTQGLR